MQLCTVCGNKQHFHSANYFQQTTFTLVLFKSSHFLGRWGEGKLATAYMQRLFNLVGDQLLLPMQSLPQMLLGINISLNFNPK